MRLQFHIKAVAAEKDPKTTVVALISITNEQGCTYEIPNQFIYIEHHDALKNTSIFKKARDSLQKRHEELEIWITLTKELKETYVDEEGNLQFKGKFLKRKQEDKLQDGTNLEKILEKLIESSTKKDEEKTIKNVKDKFVLENFNEKKSNAKQWINTFEKECVRFKIEKDEIKIELLRLFLSGVGCDWYMSMRIKEDDNDWTIWKEKFLETFENRGWTARAYAHFYRYKEGSLVEYAIKKERILLEINKLMDTDTLIDRIAFGLPEWIREKIDRDQIKTTAELTNEIRRYEGRSEKQSREKVSKKIETEKVENKRKEIERRPCKICESIGKKNRYHLEGKCWYKEERKDRAKTIGNNTVIEVDINTEEKNE